MTNLERAELKKAMEEKKLIRTYKNPDGSDAMTDPIPVWKFEQLMTAFAKVDILEKQIAEMKDELKETRDKACLYAAENAKLKDQLQRIDDERLMKLFEH